MSTQQPDETKYPCFTTTKKPNPMLVVRTSGGERFQLPYFHLLGGQYRSKTDTQKESYIIEFAFHVVNIEGVNLFAMVSAIDEMKVKFIKPATKDTPEPAVRVIHIDVAYRHGDD